VSSLTIRDETRRRRRSLRVGSWPASLGAALLVLLLSVPFFWMVSASLRPLPDIFAIPPKWLPWPVTLDNYRGAFERGNLDRAFYNSIFIASSSTALTLVIACPAAYAFARFSFAARRTLLLSTLVTQLFPAAMLVIPLYRFWAELNMFDTYQALIVTYVAFNLPLSIWLLTAFFRTVPKDLEEASLVDGSSRFGSFLRITLPLSRPGLAACAIFIAIGLWQEFLFALSFTTSPEMRTLPIALYSFVGERGTEWNLILAVAVMMTVPILVLFAPVQRQFVQGLSAGSVK
jgi:multiple sugar transport system permease protein/raffinose/stachyose/melibiose transport system permease protein